MITLSQPLTGLILKFEVVVDQSVRSTRFRRLKWATHVVFAHMSPNRLKVYRQHPARFWSFSWQRNKLALVLIGLFWQTLGMRFLLAQEALYLVLWISHILWYLCSSLLARASFSSTLPNFSLASCFCCWLTNGGYCGLSASFPLLNSLTLNCRLSWNLLGSTAFTDDACANAWPSRSCSPAVLRVGLLLSSWMVAFILPDDAALVSDAVEGNCTSLSSHISHSRCVSLSSTIADAGCESLISPTSFEFFQHSA